MRMKCPDAAVIGDCHSVTKPRAQHNHRLAPPPSRAGRDPSILETPTALATPSTTSVPKVAAMGQDKCKLSVNIEHQPLDVHAPGCVAIEEDGIMISPKTVSQPTNGPGEDHLTR